MNIGIVEENKVLRKWYEENGFIHIGTKKFVFFHSHAYIWKCVYKFVDC